MRSGAFDALAELAETAPTRAGLAVLEEAETCPPVAPPTWLAAFVELLLSGRRVAASAKACGVTPEHASRITARWYGDPPSRLVQEDRLRRAVRALLAGRPPAAAAAEAGYADQAHLTRALRAEIGVTPAKLPRS